ncbi:MAG: hypothetical protein HYX39_07630 [Bacteroidetes bacterium]|nr:hypothetical protein [Bacteroidota bacterium]
MKEIFWTIIIIWLVYQLMNIFKSMGNIKKFSSPSHSSRDLKNTSSDSKKDVKTAIKKHADKEGEFVDYEEIK